MQRMAVKKLLTRVNKEEASDGENGKEKVWELEQNTKNFAMKRMGGLNREEGEGGGENLEKGRRPWIDGRWFLHEIEQ